MKNNPLLEQQCNAPNLYVILFLTGEIYHVNLQKGFARRVYPKNNQLNKYPTIFNAAFPSIRDFLMSFFTSYGYNIIITKPKGSKTRPTVYFAVPFNNSLLTRLREITR